ncbi:Allantoinase [Spathaspora sp. JA1]|nr:Allantoinase [Spathaspora sp. JA1]
MITAQAVLYKQHGEPKDVLFTQSFEIDDENLSSNQIVVKTLASPVNPSDINQIQGVYPSKPEKTTQFGTDEPAAPCGNEGLFQVIATGDKVENLHIGDWVIPANVNFGTWRTHALGEETDFIQIPNPSQSRVNGKPLGLTINQGATISVNPMTALLMLTHYVKLNPGKDWFIQNGGTSAVGQYATQIGRLLDIHSISVIRDRPNLEDKIDELKEKGATQVITEDQNGSKEFGPAIKNWVKETGGELKLALNCVGGKSSSGIARKLNNNGLMLTYGVEFITKPFDSGYLSFFYSINMSIALSSTRVLVESEIIEATIIFSPDTGKIIAIFPQILELEDPILKLYNVYIYKNVTPRVIMPGLVDTHVHLNEPGRTHWEGFETGTKSAASGGVTCIIDMPLNSIPPVTTVSNFQTKIDAAKGSAWVDLGFWGGLIPDNVCDLIPLINMGVRGFKGFLIDSGVEEFPAISNEDILKAMKEVQFEKTMLMFHAEMDHQELALDSSLDPTLYSSFLDSRPDRFETQAIGEIIQASSKFPTIPVHIVHVSTHLAIPLLAAAKQAQLPITAETCFHYLSLTSETIPSKSTHFKCCPPIRTEYNKKLLWDGLRTGVITTVVSDHSPCTPQLKQLDKGNFFEAWGGISSVGLGLSIIFTEGQKLSPKISLTEINQWCSINTAKQVGLSHCKGKFKVGYDADILVFDDEAEYVIDNRDVHFKNKLTAYNGMKLTGRVIETFVRGNLVYNSETGHSNVPLGKLMLEPRIE